MCESIYNFFDNSTVSVIIAVLLAILIGFKQYQKQKNIDRDIDTKKDIIRDITFLKEKTHYALFIIDRIANSYQLSKKIGRTDDAFFKDVMKEYEIPRLSAVINEEIPSIKIRIMTKFGIYFRDNEAMEDAHKLLESELKKWHDKIARMDISFRKRVKDQSHLSLDALDDEVKKLIYLIWESNPNS